MKRNTTPSLFDAAEARASLGIARASSKANHVAPDWEEQAVEAVRKYAATHDRFLSEDVRATFDTPDDVDGRAWGQVMRLARSRGIIRSDGYAPANSSNGSPKCVWRRGAR